MKLIAQFSCGEYLIKSQLHNVIFNIHFCLDKRYASA